MAGLRLPGPVCKFLGALDIDAGTMCRSTSPAPGPVKGLPPKAPHPKTQVASPNRHMVASDNAARFIASFEAMAFICPDLKVRAYQDTRGNWTIGIGEMSGRDANSVFASESDAYTSFISKVKGDYTDRVRSDLKRAGVQRQLTQYEFDALVDLAYHAGNCRGIARIIAKGKAPTGSDFVAQTDGFADRRMAEYNLFSGQKVTVKGYTRFMRLDNTNGGYSPINGKRGYKRVPSADQYTLTY